MLDKIARIARITPDCKDCKDSSTPTFPPVLFLVSCCFLFLFLFFFFLTTTTKQQTGRTGERGVLQSWETLQFRVIVAKVAILPKPYSAKYICISHIQNILSHNFKTTTHFLRIIHKTFTKQITFDPGTNAKKHHPKMMQISKTYFELMIDARRGIFT